MPEAESLTQRQKEILEHLKDLDSQFITTSKIADQLDMSRREIGANIGKIRKADIDITIKQWSKSSNSTWKIN